ncbi:unnamed protein product [Anisakis simplex]|uniref:GATA-type domain-containing protein n=1 Tax=Anisakis simplex TaxID=6269 RepID=A0A0M3JS14_ANISI|nr:unnamed protein product [Anisakis simplex]
MSCHLSSSPPIHNFASSSSAITSCSSNPIRTPVLARSSVPNPTQITNQCLTRRARSCGINFSSQHPTSKPNATQNSNPTPTIRSFFQETYSVFCAPAAVAQLSIISNERPQSKSRRSSACTNASVSNLQNESLSIVDLAEDSGLLLLNPSDLVFETSQSGIAYYDFVLSAAPTSSSSQPSPSTSLTPLITPHTNSIYPTTAPINAASGSAHGGYQLFLIKFDAKTNVEWFETTEVSNEIMMQNTLPYDDLAMMTLGVLTWKDKIQRSRVLCLVKRMESNSTQSLEALKRATNKFKCLHHVLSIGERKLSVCCASNKSSSLVSSFSCSSRCRLSQDGMKLRVLMCQSCTKLDQLPSQALRETKCLLHPSSNPILCLCFPLS